VPHHHDRRSTDGTGSKCGLRLATESLCCSARAAIQASLAGIGAPLLERNADPRVRHGRRLGNGKDLEPGKVRLQPRLVGRAMPGQRDAVAELAEHDHRDAGTRRALEDGTEYPIAVDERR
jgi:hypothetical protein